MPKSRLGPKGQPPASLISADIDSLTQGVSQQPSHLRQVGQGEKQVNAWSSPVNGLTKRRPAEFVGRVLTTQEDDFYLETMPVTANERYSVFIRPFDDDGEAKIKVLITLNGVVPDIDLHGTGMEIDEDDDTIVCDNTSYLFNEDDLFNKYVLISNGSLGLLLNRERVVAMDASEETPAQPFDSLIFIKGVNFDVTYTVTIDGTDVATFTTPAADDDPNTISTDAVAEDLATELNDLADFTAERNGSVVHLVKDDGTDYDIQISDTRSNNLATVIKGSVTNFTELPTVAPNGFLINIEGSPDTVDDDIWVEFQTRDGVDFGDGVWVETTGPEVMTTLDVDTMPLVIYRDARQRIFVGPADGTEQTITIGDDDFSYTFPAWGERTAGTEDSVPTPSFVGNTIRDHCFFRQRYCVVAGENVVLSEVDEVLNFFNDTAIQVLDTDPIDVTTTSETSIPLEWMLPVDEGLLVFSQKSQFQMRAADADVLTPRTAIVLRLSNIDMNQHVRPRIAGPNVIFATEEYGFTGFREYQFFDTQQRRIGLNLGGNLNLTLNVPKYIKGLTTHWDVGESLDYFVCLSPDDKKKLYVYKYLWRSGQGQLVREQSSWSEWKFDGDIQWVRFFDNKLWIVATYSDGTYTMTIEAEELTDIEEPEIYLDRKILFPECNSTFQTTDNITSSYDSANDRTTFTLPYEVTGTTDAVVRFSEDTNKGLVLGSIDEGSEMVCDQKGDWRETDIAFGRRYKFEYEFTRAHKPTRDQGKQRIIGDLHGRLQVATWTVNHYNSGNYDVRVKRLNRANDSVHTHSSVWLDVANNKLTTEDTSVYTGKFRVPVYCKNTHTRVIVESDTWMPLTLTSCYWEGNFNDRARSVG
jgi:hypothetical protein